MRRTITNIISIIMICLCGCFLVGCPSPNDESKEAEEYVKQAIPIAEEALKSVHPNATLQKASLQGISGNMVGPDHGLTDWVKGVYRDSSDEDILINVITQEIYTTSEVKKINTYGMDLAYELYKTDSMSMEGSVGFSFEVPYCSNDIDKYGNMVISNMLPIDVVADDDFIAEFLSNPDYPKTYYLTVGEEFDMSIFGNTDIGSLGNNVRVNVKQYSDEYLQRRYTPGFRYWEYEPIATYDSEESN